VKSKNAGTKKTAWGFTSDESPTRAPGKIHTHHLGFLADSKDTQTVSSIMKKYIDSGMKYETGIEIGLSAMMDEAKAAQLIDIRRRAITKVKITVPIKKIEFIDLVQE
jgi:hypothetical protein